MTYKENPLNPVSEPVAETEPGYPWMGVLVGVIALAALLMGGLSLWQLYKSSHVPHVVDLAGISRTYQEQAKNQGLQEGISNEQRGQILQNLQAKMNTLEQVIQAYATECQCNLYVKSAIVGRYEVKDVTREIMRRIDQKVPGTAVVAAPQR